MGTSIAADANPSDTVPSIQAGGALRYAAYLRNTGIRNAIAISATTTNADQINCASDAR
jgi:hypothetical protein